MKQIIRYTWLLAVLTSFGCADDSDDAANLNAELFEEQQQTIDQYLQERDITTQENSSGIHYRALSENPNGDTLAREDIVDLYYEVTTLEGNAIAAIDSSSSPLTYTFGTGSLVLPLRLDEMINLMRVGEEYEFYLPSNWAYLDYSLPSVVPPNSIVVARVRLAASLTLAEQAEREDRTIISYLEGEQLGTIDSLAKDVYYVQTQAGDTAVSVTSSSIVGVQYTGSLLDGTVFDSNTASNPLEFDIARGGLISGFLAAVQQMDLGEKGTVIMPSQEAYGSGITAMPHSVVGTLLEQGNIRPELSFARRILPYSPLRFDIEIVSIQ